MSECFASVWFMSIVCRFTQVAHDVCFAPVLDSICLFVDKLFMVLVCSAPVLDNSCLCVDTSGLWCLSILHQCWAASVHVFTQVVHGVCLNILCYCWIFSVCVFTRMICGVCPFCSSLCLHKWFMVSECWTALYVCVFTQVVHGV